jgi:hypothetical protein
MVHQSMEYELQQKSCRRVVWTSGASKLLLLTLHAPARKASCDSCSAPKFLLVKESLVIMENNEPEKLLHFLSDTARRSLRNLVRGNGSSKRAFALHRSIKSNKGGSIRESTHRQSQPRPLKTAGRQAGRPLAAAPRHRRIYKDEKGREKQAQVRDTSSHLSAHWMMTIFISSRACLLAGRTVVCAEEAKHAAA